MRKKTYIGLLFTVRRIARHMKDLLLLQQENIRVRIDLDSAYIKGWSRISIVRIRSEAELELLVSSVHSEIYCSNMCKTSKYITVYTCCRFLSCDDCDMKCSNYYRILSSQYVQRFSPSSAIFLKFFAKRSI